MYHINDGRRPLFFVLLTASFRVWITRVDAWSTTTTLTEKQNNSPSSCTSLSGPSALLLFSQTDPDDVPTGQSTNANKRQSDNSAMAFLRKIGKVGGPPVDFTNALGVDEGSGGKTGGAGENSKARIDSMMGSHSHPVIRKSKLAYRSCVDSGSIDDLSESFPFTSSGSQWTGVTDRGMGGESSGTLTREPNFDGIGHACNVLRAKVRLNDNQSGFVQMVTNLALDPAVSTTVDASSYDGIELDLCYHEGVSVQEKFNVHLKNSNCTSKFSSYRTTFELIRGKWTTIRLPWNSFEGFGIGAAENPFDPSSLRRVGVVAIGKAMDVTLALSSIRFLKKPVEER